jgi:nucleoside-triphosphatase
MQKRLTLITGAPGIGKTTVIMRVAEVLKAQGKLVGGMTSKEQRDGEVRKGFLIQDLSNGDQGWLASVNQPDGPRVGKYRVNLHDLENIGAKAIKEATKSADVIIIDEIGPMELRSLPFKKASQEALNSSKPVIATIHFKAADEFVTDIKNRSDAELIEVTFHNREGLHNLITEKITKTLKGD